MAYPVRRTLHPVALPKLRLAGLGAAPAAVLAELQAAQDAAMARVTASNTHLFNTIVERANALRDALANSSATSPANDAEGGQVLMAFRYFSNSGELPPGWSATYSSPGSSEGGIPWLWVAGGAAGLFALWMWSRKQRESAGAMGDVIAGFSEDCGCDGGGEDEDAEES